MNSRLPLLICFAFTLQASAQDVNNPTATPLDRPQGPGSAPGIAAPKAPLASTAPTTSDPNAPVDSRTTPFPPEKADRDTARGRNRNPPPNDALKRGTQSNGF